MKTPQKKIEIIRNSVRCFQRAALSLVPLFGAPFLYFAIRSYGRVWGKVGAGWNPAGRHLQAGFILCWLGAVSQMAGLAFVIRLLFGIAIN